MEQQIQVEKGLRKLKQELFQQEMEATKRELLDSSEPINRSSLSTDKKKVQPNDKNKFIDKVQKQASDKNLLN